ncbi:carboxylate-amine ligase [Tundrisphaera sp. TA3]|uniref:carboxylate-amine ligase n=1 Tax=Tundrisphaera sp. TA3 TaxID=3435775 RepID=UPI003EB8C05E
MPETKPTTDDFTIGVEEEYQIVDPETRELKSRAFRILPGAKEDVGDKVTNELFLSQIEIGTPVCRTLAEVRDELVRLRKAVVEAAAEQGCRIVAAGTHPFSRWQDQRLTPKERYDKILEENQQLAREQIIFGCHVHVGIADREDGIRVMNRVRPWLPTLLALSANSPYWLGRDTGYASYRTELFQRFPMTGIPGAFADRAEYDATVQALIDVGAIPEASRIYWDVRPSSHFETIEFRIADVCARVDEAVAIAALCRALARTCLDRAQRGEPAPQVRPELLRAAKWRAARYGLEGDLVDLHSMTSAPARSVVDRLMQFVRPAMEADGEWDEVSATVEEILAKGNGASRQRARFARDEDLNDAVDGLIEETAAGLD